MREPRAPRGATPAIRLCQPTGRYGPQQQVWQITASAHAGKSSGLCDNLKEEGPQRSAAPSAGMGMTYNMLASGTDPSQPGRPGAVPEVTLAVDGAVVVHR